MTDRAGEEKALEAIPARLLTVDQVADLLNISRRSVYSLMDAGKLRSLKIGGLRRIEPETVKRFLEECRRTVRG